MTLTEFLLARIAEDEALASGADTAKAWSVGIYRDEHAVMSADGDLWIARCGTTADSQRDMAHIVRHDPARILAECEAKRCIVEDHEWDESQGSPVEHSRELRHLATVYADHPDYRDEWRP